MAFLRVKRQGEHRYAYLVANKWNPRTHQPRQRVLTYLGRLDRLEAARVPKRWRLPSILRKLRALQRSDSSRRRLVTTGLRGSFLRALLENDERSASRIAGRAIRISGFSGFHNELLGPALHEIGEGWRSGRVSVAEEHVATGLAVRLLGRINERSPPPAASRKLVVLCVPEGEQHTLPLMIAEGVLRRRGIPTANTGGSAPLVETLRYVDQAAPAAVLISLAQPANLGAAHTLASAIRARHATTRVVIGGRGLTAGVPGPEPEGVEFSLASIDDFLETWDPEEAHLRTPGGSAGRPRGRNEVALRRSD